MLFYRLDHPFFSKKQFTSGTVTKIQFNTEFIFTFVINMGPHLYRFVYITDSQWWMASVYSICNIDGLRLFSPLHTFILYFSSLSVSHAYHAQTQFDKSKEIEHLELSEPNWPSLKLERFSCDISIIHRQNRKLL